jgi:hypothetical protein
MFNTRKAWRLAYASGKMDFYNKKYLIDTGDDNNEQYDSVYVKQLHDYHDYSITLWVEINKVTCSFGL